jgi:hypothetical protein
LTKIVWRPDSADCLPDYEMQFNGTGEQAKCAEFGGSAETVGRHGFIGQKYRRASIVSHNIVLMPVKDDLSPD